MHKNTRKIIAWMERMMPKTRLCGVALVESLAWYLDEEGNENPSDEAITVARMWERDPQLIYDVITESGKWCGEPTSGCLLHCRFAMWKDFPTRLKVEEEQNNG